MKNYRLFMLLVTACLLSSCAGNFTARKYAHRNTVKIDAEKLTVTERSGVSELERSPLASIPIVKNTIRKNKVSLVVPSFEKQSRTERREQEDQVAERRKLSAPQGIDPLKFLKKLVPVEEGDHAWISYTSFGIAMLAALMAFVSLIALFIYGIASISGPVAVPVFLVVTIMAAIVSGFIASVFGITGLATRAGKRGFALAGLITGAVIAMIFLIILLALLL